MRVIVKRKSSFARYSKKFITILIVFVLGILILSAEDEDGYLFVLNNLKASGGTMMELVQTAMKEIASIGKKTKGRGKANELNLDLIDRINPNTAKKGYIKELLELARDTQNGKIYKNGGISVQAALGFWHNEVGWSSAGAPNFYIRPSQYKKGTQYSLLGYTTNSFNGSIGNPGGLNESGGIGINQNTNGASIDGRAKINPNGGVSRGAGGNDRGDARFAPDDLATVSKALLDNGAEFKQCKTDNYLNILPCLINNRGGGGFHQEITGLTLFNNSANWGNLTRKLKSEILDNTASIYDDFLDADGKPVAKGDNKSSMVCGIIVALNSKAADQWFINNSAYNSCMSSGYVSWYKKLYPKTKKSDSAIKNELKDHVASSLAVSLTKVTGKKFSTVDTRIAYGTSGDYSDASYRFYRDYGAVWFVSKKLDSARYYAGSKQMPYVSAYDGVAFAYTYDTTLVGRYDYGQLLKNAGVNSVDPTNPETYLNSVEDDNESGGTFVELSKNVLTNEQYRIVRPDKVSGDRAKILQRAFEVVKSKQFVYYWGGGHTQTGKWGSTKIKSLAMMKSNASYSRSPAFYNNLKYPIYGYDCSGFVCNVYNSTGVATSVTGTSGFLSGNWKVISWSDLKPGDALLDAGHHVVLYLGRRKNGMVIAAEAMCSGHYVEITERSTFSNYVPVRRKTLND